MAHHHSLRGVGAGTDVQRRVRRRARISEPLGRMDNAPNCLAHPMPIATQSQAILAAGVWRRMDIGKRLRELRQTTHGDGPA